MKKFKFVLEPTKDGCLQVRSYYSAGDIEAMYVESRLRLLLEVVEADAGNGKGKGRGRR